MNKEIIKCEVCGKNIFQITQTHLNKCSSLSVQEYKNKYPNAKIRTEKHSKKIKDTNKKYKVGNLNPMKNPKHLKKMKENQLKAVRDDDYRKKVSERQKKNNNNPHIFGPGNKPAPKTPDGLRRIRKSIIERRKSLGLSSFIPMYNKNACKIFDYISSKTNTNIIHGDNGGEYFIENLYYWVDGYDNENNIVYEFDEQHHFDSKGKLREKDLIREGEIKELLKCKFIRITENTDIDRVVDIVNDFIEIEKRNGFSKITHH